MKPRSRLWRAAARETQAWFVIGIFWAGIAFAGWLSFADPTGNTDPATPLLGVAGCFFLTFAVPYAAIRVAEWERDGRLDQLRLTGRPPLSLLLALGGPAAAPWAISGVISLAVGALLGGLPPYLPQIVLLVAGAGASVSVLAMSLRRSRHISDFRIVMIAAGMYAATFSTITTNADVRTRGLMADYLLSHPSRVAIVVGLLAALTAWRFPRMLAGLARPHPPLLRSRSPAPATRTTLAVPAAVKRGVSIGLVAGSGLTIFELLIVAGLVAAGRPPLAEAALAAAFLPWIVGALVISITSRSDVESGRLDVLRLNPAPAAVSAVRMTLDMWLPFFASISIIMVTFAVVGTGTVDPSDTFFAVVVTAVVAPMALVEGWHRGLMLTYFLPAMVGAVSLMPPVWRRTPEALLPFLAVAWIPWGVAAAALRRGIGVPLDRRFAMLAAAGVVLAGDWAAATMRMRSWMGTTAALLVLAAWLDDGKRSWRTVWTLPAIVLAIGLLLRARFDDQVSAALAAVLPAIGLLCALRIHQALARLAQPWSIAVRTLLALFLGTLDSAAFRVLIVPRMSGAGSIGPASFVDVYRIGVAAAIIVLIAATLFVEAYARLAQRRAIPRA